MERLAKEDLGLLGAIDGNGISRRDRRQIHQLLEMSVWTDKERGRVEAYLQKYEPLVQSARIERRKSRLSAREFQTLIIRHYIQDKYRMEEKGEHEEVVFDFYLLERLGERLLLAFPPPDDEQVVLRDKASWIRALRKLTHSTTAVVVCPKLSYWDETAPSVKVLARGGCRLIVDEFVQSDEPIDTSALDILELQVSLKDVDTMSGAAFERLLQRHFSRLGYTVQPTPISGDYGAGLVLSRGAEKIVVQAKRYKGRVGIDAVQEAIGARDLHDATRAMVITNSGFTPNARRLAEKSSVELWDRGVLLDVLTDADIPVVPSRRSALPSTRDDQEGGERVQPVRSDPPALQHQAMLTRTPGRERGAKQRIAGILAGICALGCAIALGSAHWLLAAVAAVLMLIVLGVASEPSEAKHAAGTAVEGNGGQGKGERGRLRK